MTRLAVKAYVKGLLDDPDLVYPMPVEVMIHRPKYANVGGSASIIVYLSEERERRESLPRGTGSKRIDDSVVLAITWATDDADLGGQQFDSLLTLIDQTVRAVGFSHGSLLLTDPESGEESALFSIGEDIRTTFYLPQTVGDDLSTGLMLFMAEKELSVIEMITA